MRGRCVTWVLQKVNLPGGPSWNQHACRVEVLSDWRAMADALTDEGGLGSKGATAAANIIQLMCACAWKAAGDALAPARADTKCAPGSHNTKVHHASGARCLFIVLLAMTSAER